MTFTIHVRLEEISHAFPTEQITFKHSTPTYQSHCIGTEVDTKLPDLQYMYFRLQ